MPDTSIAERVLRGVAWLDQHDPGCWREDAAPASTRHDSEPIDLDRLDLACPRGCILGHRWGHFGHAILDAPLPRVPLRDLGFEAAEDGEYTALTAEWRRVIRERREAVTVYPLPTGGA